MPENHSNQFDDSILKSAVCRAWGHQRAPDSLRDQVTALLADHADSDIPADTPNPIPLPPGAWRLPAWAGYAAAAMVTLAVGLVGWQYLSTTDQPANGGPVLAGGLPASFINDIVHTHDRCCNFDNHHTVDAPRDNFQLIRQQLEDRLGEPVWVVDATSEGWQFRGAAICRVKDRQSAHLLYDRPRRNHTLSVLSVPFDGHCSLGRGEVVALDLQANHPVAGFIADGEFHCLVGHSPDGSLTLTEIHEMTERYQNNLKIVRMIHPEVMAADR